MFYILIIGLKVTVIPVIIRYNCYNIIINNIKITSGTQTPTSNDRTNFKHVHFVHNKIRKRYIFRIIVSILEIDTTIQQ